MYIKKTWIYGNRIEVKKYHTSRYGVKGEKRSKREKPSDESLKRANERKAKKKLERLMINNFEQGDWHLTLTYKSEMRPDIEKSKYILKKFFEKLRKEYRKHGIELKYIMATEWENKNIHHHIVINDIDNISKVLSRLWIYGGIHLTPLYPDRDYSGLAEYFIKETNETFRNSDNPYKQRYTCSRNLKKPIEEVEIIKASTWVKEPKINNKLLEQGYQLDKQSIYTGVDAMGYGFCEYTFIRYTLTERAKNESKRLKYK